MPLLCRDGVDLAPFVHSWFLQPLYYEGLIQSGHSKYNLGDYLTDDSVFLFVYFDIGAPPRSSTSGFCLADSGVCQQCTL